MKKFTIFFLVLTLVFTLSIGSLFAGDLSDPLNDDSSADPQGEAVLIDFNLLKANGDGDPKNSKAFDDPDYNNYEMHLYTKDNNPALTQHMPTLVDFSSVAGTNYSDEELEMMRTSLACNNWEVVLNSSAQNVENNGYSFCKEWHTKSKDVLRDNLGVNRDFRPDGYTILGVRIHFPETPFNCSALVKPPFEIPAYEDIHTDFQGFDFDGGVDSDGNKTNYAGSETDLETAYKNGKLKRAKFEKGYGVVKNVGVLKEIAVNVYGTNFKNSMSILLKDENQVITEYSLPDYLDFDGWRTIVWTNPNYIERVENRSLYIVPLYPRSEPYIKFYGFRFARQGDQLGGDFITYIKDIKVKFDLAIRKIEAPINHEDAWGILEDRTVEARKKEISKLGHKQILEFLERDKMHKD